MKKQKIKDPNKKKGLGVIWKSILITFSSIIGVAGIIFLGMYLAGSFTTEPVNPEDLFFANKVVVEEETTYVSNSGNPYNVDSNFEVYVSTSTEESNQNEIEFSFPKNQTQYYLTKVESTEGLSSSVKIVYAKDSNGALQIFASCSAEYESANYITNGIIIAPRNATLNTPIKISVAIAPNDINGNVSSETKLYNVGGYSQLIATSVSNVAIGSTSAQINVDVPIEEIEVIGITGDNLSSSSIPGTNENLLGNKINTESLFSTIVNVTPSRAIYKYGKDGSSGEAEYKTIIFALDNDVNNSGEIISFIDSNNEQIENSYCENGKVFVFDGKTTKGQSFLTTTLTGNIKIHARAFKTAASQDLASGSLSEIFSLMIGEGAVSSDKEFEIQQIAIGGFSATEDYDINNPLKFGINKDNIIFANNSNSANNLGIEIIAGQGSAQNNIKNILISIQYSNGTKWFDATKANETIPQLFSFDSRNTLIEKNIGEESFNFFRPILISASNNSYWNVFALPGSENLASYGIVQIQIKIYYLNPETNELVLDNTAYGPYSVETNISETIAPVLGWNESEEIKTNSTLGAGLKNERVFFEGANNAKNNIINLQNLPKIENIGNSTYNIVKYFVSSENENLQDYLNVTKYNGTISGVADSNIYLVNETETNLVVRALEDIEIEFKLFFAVVEHSFSDVLINSDGTFNIVKVPTNLIGNLVFAPIKIQKTLNLLTDVSIEIDEMVEGENIVKPYVDSNEGFFLQNQENNIKLILTINNDQTDLFFNLAREGDISFKSNSDLYSLLNVNKIDLEDIFSKIFIEIKETKETVGEDEVIKKTFDFGGTTYEIKEDGIYVDGSTDKTADIVEGKFELEEKVFEIDEENLCVILGKSGKTLTINLSTNLINFGEDDEKISTIELNYEISATNAPESIKNQTIEKELNIYSGKVVNAYFGTEENGALGSIAVSKEFANGEFSINGLSETSLVGQKDGTYFVNVFVDGFGIDDSYTVESNDSNVVSLTWVDGKYQISFVGDGEATLTLSLNYPNSTWTEKQITINVSSNYETNATYPATSTTDSRISPYDEAMGYQIVGSDSTDSISLLDLIKITATTDGKTEGVDVTGKFTFSPYLDSVARAYVSFDSNSNALTINKNVGSDLSFTISVSSQEIGATYYVKIVLTPVYQIDGDFENHEDAEKPETSKENVYGVYAETEIDALNILIKELAFNSESQKWIFGTGSASGLNYSLFDSSGEIITATEIKNGEATIGIKFGNVATLNISDNTISSIVFSAVSGTYVLRVSNVEDPTIYDVVKEFVFHVSPNIELGEVVGGELNETKDEIVINNTENPVLNGQIVKFENNKIVLGETGIEIPVQRIKETSVSFGSVTIEGLDANGKISGVKELSTKTIKISYGGKDLFVEFYVAPNITANNAEKVTYDGKEYISLYAGMDISNISSWFVANNEVSVVLGNLVMDGKIKSLPRLYDLAKNNASVVKTEDGFIITQIYVTVGEGENQEVRAFDALVSPFEWSEFIKYGGDEEERDIKDVLGGDLTQEILSGNNLVFDDGTGNFYVNDVDSYINSSTNKMTYKLFKREDGSGVEVQIIGETGFAYLGFDGGKLALITEPNAKNYIYRVEFTYTGKAEGFQDATFVFSYYVEATATQTIEVYYPHLEDKSEEQQLDFDNYGNLFATDDNNKHIVYFDQFVDGKYEIALETNLRHYNSKNDKFVQVQVSGENANETLKYNDINYSIYKLYNNNVEVVSGIENFVEVSKDGKITIKNNSSVLGIVVKAETPNGAVAYYKVLVKSRDEQNVEFNGDIVPNFDKLKLKAVWSGASQGIYISDTKLELSSDQFTYFGTTYVVDWDNETIKHDGIPVETDKDGNFVVSVNLETGTPVGEFKVYDADEREITGINFQIINKDGKLQTSDNMDMVYLVGTQITIAPSPNQQSAILVIYSEALGTIAEIEIVSPSPIKVGFDQGDETVYGDSTVDLKSYIEATFNNNNVDENELDYRIEFDEEAYSYILYSEGSNLTIYPIAEEKTFKFKVYVWGEAEEGGENPLPGTSEDYPATIDDCELILTPSVTIKDQTTASELRANEDMTISTDDIFEVATGFDPSDYKFEASLTWNGGENEFIGIGGIETLTVSNQESWTIHVSHVAAQRTAVLTVKLWKDDGRGNQLGEAVEGTYKIIINPVITATVTYPNYGTGETFDSESIYVKEKVFEGESQTGIELESDGRVVAGGSVVYKSANPDLIEINDSTKVTVTDDGKAIEKLTHVAINICVQTAGADTPDKTDDKYIVIGTYNLILSPNPVLKLEFENGGTEMSEAIPDSEFEENTIFPVEDGKISVLMKTDSLNLGISSVTIFGQSKFKGTSDLSPVTIYLLGDNNAKLAKLFISSNDNNSDMESGVPGRIASVSSFDILGTTADDSIAEINEENNLVFKKVGSWFVEVTTSGEKEYYYVFTSRGEEGEIDAQIYSPLDKHELSMKDLFGQSTNVTNYEFSYGNVNGEGVSQVNFTTPKTKLNFFYVANGVEYEIPYQTATENKTYFEIDDDDTAISILKYELNYAQKEITILNKFGTTVGTFDYKFVLDYKFDESKFNEVNTGNVGSGYDKGEFEGYKEGGTNVDLKVSETIQLTAGTEYSLVQILKDKLGLTKLDGSEFSFTENTKIDFVLEHGEYLTNEAYSSNKSGIISLISNDNDKDTKILPHGAKNNGDIVHLVLTVSGGEEGEKQTEEYILRIKINPIAEIVANNFTGEYLIQYTGSNLQNTSSFSSDDHLIALDELLSMKNINKEELVVSVVSNNSANYVRKSGSNRLASWYKSGSTYKEELDGTEGSTNFEKVYGIILTKTVLGGAEIQLLITDAYGYQVTDESGNPMIITIKYSNSYGSSVQLDTATSGNIIYEGDSFEIWATLEVEGTTFYAQYSNGSWTNYQSTLPTAGGESTLIVLDGIPKDSNESGSLAIITDNKFKINEVEYTVDWTGEKITYGTNNQEVTVLNVFEIDGVQYVVDWNNQKITYGTENSELSISTSKFTLGEGDAAVEYTVDWTNKKITYGTENNQEVTVLNVFEIDVVQYVVDWQESTVKIQNSALTSLTVTLSDSETLKANEKYWDGGVLGEDNKINFGDSALFGSENKVDGKNFNLKIEVAFNKGGENELTETLSFDFNTAVAQRYKLVLTSPFNSEDTVKLPYVKVGGTYQVKTGYRPDDIFEVYDLKNNATTTTDNSLPGISIEALDDDHDFKPVVSVEYSNTFFVQDGDGTWTGRYIIDGGQGTGTVSFDYEYVSEYCYLDLSGATTYRSYGIVLEGASEKLKDQAFFEKLNGAVLKDYYGTSSELVNTAGDNWEISGFAQTQTWSSITAGETINIPVYGDSENKNIIGYIPVTRSRYEAIQTLGGTLAEKDGYLPFTVAGETGWGDVVGAIVSGSNGTTEGMSGKTSGFFDYELLKVNNTDILNARMVNTGEYYTIQLNDQDSDFIVTVKYMANVIGYFTIKKDGDDWEVEQNISSLEVDGYLYKTTTVEEVSSLYCYGFPEEVTQATQLQTVSTQTIEQTGPAANVPSTISITFNNKELTIPVAGVGNQTQTSEGDSWGPILNASFYTSVTLGDGITAIGDEAFNGCADLISIEIPSSVTTIGTYAFSGSTGLTSVTFAENSQLTTIGRFAFYGCVGLISIEIPVNVSGLAVYTFHGCEALESITINGTLQLAGIVFFGCKSLTTLTIGDAVTSLPGNLFDENNLEYLRTINCNAASLNDSLPKYSKNDVEIKWVYETETITTDNFKGAGTYTAKDPVTITTSVDGGNGAISSSTTVPYGSSGTITFTPNEGYYVSKITVGGTEETYTQTEDLKNYTINPVTANIEVKVSFSIKKHTVTFVDYNRTELKVQEYVEWGTSATAPADPTRTGYTFTGWDKSFTNVTEDLTVTAQYNINTYTVTFEDYDGTVLKTEPVNYSSSATAPDNPAREGYTFTGWNKDFSNITDNLTVTANYIIQQRTVVVKNQDGETLESRTVDWGHESLEFTVVPQSGYGIASISGAQDNTVTAINGGSQKISLTNIKNNYIITVTFAQLSENWTYVESGEIFKIKYIGSETEIEIPEKVNGRSDWTGISTDGNWNNLRKIVVIDDVAETDLPSFDGVWYSTVSNGDAVSKIGFAGIYVALENGFHTSNEEFTFTNKNGTIYLTGLPSSNKVTINKYITIAEGIQVNIDWLGYNKTAMINLNKTKIVLNADGAKIDKNAFQSANIGTFEYYGSYDDETNAFNSATIGTVIAHTKSLMEHMITIKVTEGFVTDNGVQGYVAIDGTLYVVDDSDNYSLCYIAGKCFNGEVLTLHENTTTVAGLLITMWVSGQDFKKLKIDASQNGRFSVIQNSEGTYDLYDNYDGKSVLSNIAGVLSA